MNLHVAKTEPNQGNLAYAGEISPTQAWEELKANPKAMLVDVRTAPEWTFSGEPNLASIGKPLIKVSWKHFPQFTVNEQFCATIASLQLAKDTPLFMLCRTGGRSLDAACALTEQGFTACYNVTDGFEGPFDGERHRGNVAGWKAANLPWIQG